MEKSVRAAIMKHMLLNELITNRQHGLVAGKSCTMQLSTCIDEWTNILDKEGSLDTLYLDLMKAFDEVPHKRLLKKRVKKRVVLNGIKSAWSPLTSGIPQGSVLVPTLFLVFINDLPEVVRAVIQMFSDDSKAFKEIASPSDANDLQTDLGSMESWTQTWQLRFNDTKCKVMHIGARNPKSDYTLRGNVTLEKTTCEKDLGCILKKQATSSTVTS